jgi:hypothetical protein
LRRWRRRRFRAHAIADGKSYVVEFNLPSPSKLVEGIGRLVADNFT